MQTRDSVRRGLLAALMIALSAVIIFPFAMMISTSFKTEAELLESSMSFIPASFSPANYITAMGMGEWPRYFYNSIFITAVSVLVSLAINSIAGYAFARLKFRGRDALFVVSLVGMMVPQQVSMVPLFIMMKNFPLVGGNDFFGSGGRGLLDNHWGIILPFIAGAFGVFLFRQFYMNFPSSLDDAAKIDGLGRTRTFLHIYVPLSAPIFATLTALKANLVWSDYTWPLIMTRTEGMRTVQLALTMFRSENETQWTLLMAATAVVTLPMVLIFLAAQKYFIEGIASTGMK